MNPRGIEGNEDDKGLAIAMIRRLESCNERVHTVSGLICMSLHPVVDGCRKAVTIGLLALVFAALAVASIAPASSATLEPLEIVTKSGVQTFAVELALTDEQRSTGLMYRRELADGRGMLFDFSPEQPISMWMKNTFISLDMIFIASDGRITRIAENTEPESTRIISSGGPARAVLEVIAGTARKYGIAPGDRIGHNLFRKK